MDRLTCSICDSRETAAVLLWRRTVCQRPAGIVCWESWAGERAAPWPRNPASIPKCPDFFPGYLQPSGWDPLCHMFVFFHKTGKDLGVTGVFLFFSVANRTITTYQGFTNWPGHEISHEHLSRRSDEDENRPWYPCHRSLLKLTSKPLNTPVVCRDSQLCFNLNRW